jgi:CTP:phosphocholine cytidylyltransferase-like protein
MSNILSTAMIPDCYVGMVKISLFNYWCKKHEGHPLLTPEKYKEYKEMYNWLEDANIPHRFEWVDEGMYLPDNVWIENSDVATAFMLKYGV